MIGMAKGMLTTIKHLFTPAFTIQYPDVKRPLPERSRMSFELTQDAEGQPQCKACMLCQKSCPDDAIAIESAKREDGPGRVLTRFSIDLGRCMYCGMCVEQCTTQGLRHTADFEVSTPTRAGTIMVLFASEASESPHAEALVPAEDSPPADEMPQHSEAEAS